MNEDRDEEFKERDIYIYIDLQDKLPDDILQEKMFFRAVNLEKENPFVQINDHLFQGTYEDSIGTNLFFEEVEKSRQADNIWLKHFVTQFKVLTLAPLKFPSKLRDIPKPRKPIKLNLDQNYASLLKKLHEGSLDLDGLILEDTDESVTLDVDKTQDSVTTVQNISSEESNEREKEVESIQEVDILYNKYEKLKNICRQPVKRVVELDPMETVSPKFKKAYEYNSIKCQVIKPCDAFMEPVTDFDYLTLENGADLVKCAQYGIIESSHVGEVLTEDERNAVLKMENLELLSLPARYSVIKTQLDEIRNYMEKQPYMKLQQVDQYGRTLSETVKIYKRLLKVLKRLISQKYSYDSEYDTDNESVGNVKAEK